MWRRRSELSKREGLIRSIYETLRDELDHFLIQKSLIDSYYNSLAHGEEYPFVDKRELKPKARIYEKEFPYHRAFIVMFCEGSLPEYCKKYIRYFDKNKVIKENLEHLVDIEIYKNFADNLRYFEGKWFFNLLDGLIPLDYAMLIQRDETVKRKTRYVLSHFYVKIDWPIIDAAEDLGKYLRYISKEIYEKGDKYGELLQQKLFEYYGCHYTAGGRRTAGLVAAEFLRKLDFISTVYVSSAESRSLASISEKGVTKFVLLRLSPEEVTKISQEHRISKRSLEKYYFITEDKGHFVVIFRVNYARTEYSKPPADGRLRELNSDYYWLTVTDQFLLPNLPYADKRPIPHKTIYI